ncbi:unnamed protein product [Agarophyton chilense]
MDKYRYNIQVQSFDGERTDDFDLWSTRIIATLERKDYVDVVNDTEEVPEEPEDPKYAAYVKKLRNCRALLMNASGDKPLPYVCNCNTPAEMWSKLWEHYAGNCVSNQISVWTALMS